MSESKISPARIAASVDKWRTDSWPNWLRERQIVAFYNSGPMPTAEECEDDPPSSLGLGYRYIKRPHDQLMEVTTIKPGMIKVEVNRPLSAGRKQNVEAAINLELNTRLSPRMISTVRSLAGRALVTGRAFLFRKTRWDWKFYTARLLCDMRSGDDIYDESFREWAFRGQITLREVDAYIGETREYEGAGWDKTGLRAIKKYILKSTSADKNSVINDSLIDIPFREEIQDDILEVYWYFRKCGEKGLDGEEYVDLYCISRYNGAGTIQTWDGGDYVGKALSLKPDNDGVQQLYYLPKAFMSVRECLIPFILDARIDGEQQLQQIDGTGKIMVPRISAMESLADSILQGVSFAVQPNWTSTTGSAIDEQEIRKLARSGINPWDYVPPGLTTMNKQNGLTGLSSGLQMIQMLGMSTEQDAATGEMSPIGQSQAQFKSEASQLINQIQQSTGRRAATFYIGFDLWMDQVAKTMCRSFTEWNVSDPGYSDVSAFQQAMLFRHGIIPTEYDSERVIGTGRRLSGDQDRAAAIQSVVMARQVFGDQMSAQGHRILAREAARAMYGDTIALELIPEEQSVPENQELLALAQNTSALDSLVPPTRKPQDNPIVHVMIHGQCVAARLQAIAQTGSITPLEKAGLTALMQHAAQDVVGLPPGMKEQQEQGMVEMARMLASLPVSGAQSEMALKEREANRREAELQMKMGNMQNLQQDREGKRQLKMQQFFLEVQKAADGNKESQARMTAMGVQNAATIVKQLRDGQAQEFDMTMAMQPQEAAMA